MSEHLPRIEESDAIIAAYISDLATLQKAKKLLTAKLWEDLASFANDRVAFAEKDRDGVLSRTINHMASNCHEHNIEDWGPHLEEISQSFGG